MFGDRKKGLNNSCTFFSAINFDIQCDYDCDDDKKCHHERGVQKFSTGKDVVIGWCVLDGWLLSLILVTDTFFVT